MKCTCGYFEAVLRKLFYNHGTWIARKPFIYLLVPLVICSALSFGLLNMTMTTDYLKLISPANSPAKKETGEIFRLFPIESNTVFIPYRIQAFDNFLTVIAFNKTGSVLSEESFAILREIEGIVRNVSTETGDSYETLCLKYLNACSGLDLGFLEAAFLLLRYPSMQTKHFTLDTTFLGGVETDKTGHLLSAKSIQLSYFLTRGAGTKEFISKNIAKLLKLNSTLEEKQLGVSLALYSSQTLGDELMKTTLNLLPRFSISVALIISFATFTCLLRDWVASKPWCGLIGALAAVLGTGAAFGLLCLCNVPVFAVVGAAPFLVLAVGIDDMFVMLSAWRATDPAQSPQERLSRCMSDAAVSITITTLTDVLGFAIGGLIPFKAIQVFCLYTGLSLTFTYVLQITFVAAFMAIDGEREAKMKHALTLKPVKPRTQASGRSWMYRVLCTGGQEDSRDTMMTRFFRERYGPMLMRRGSRVVVMVLYVCYLAAAIYGATRLEEGLELSHLSNDDSYSKLFFQLDYAYYRKYGPYVSVVVEEPLVYNRTEDQARIEDLLQTFEASSCFHGSEQTISWLRAFRKYQNATRYTVSKDYIEDVHQFLKVQEREFFNYDVAFDDKCISATRYLVRQKDVDTTEKDKECMVEARRIAAASDLQVFVFSEFYKFYDQYLYIFSGTMQNLSIATGVMFIVSLIFIPDPVCSLWVVLAIVSIEVGVIGFMALWGVKLHSISMVCLIICIGFCVDYSAHITYAYSISQPPRVPSALGLLGVPIVQGGISTLAGVVLLSMFESEIFRIFFKIIFLVIVFGLLHGVVLLPIWLDMPALCCPKQKTRGSRGRERAHVIATDPSCLLPIADYMSDLAETNNRQSFRTVNKQVRERDGSREYSVLRMANCRTRSNSPVLDYCVKGSEVYMETVGSDDGNDSAACNDGVVGARGENV